MKGILRIDASILCFAIVILAAIPVASLRTRTYSLGYELGALKLKEQELRQRTVELQSDLAETQRAVRDRHVGATTSPAQLQLPAENTVIHGRPQ